MDVLRHRRRDRHRQRHGLGPLGAIATRNLPVHQAGAGSGIYNTNRQMGAVLGSAVVGALFVDRIAAHLPGIGGGGDHFEGSVVDIPAAVHEPYSKALSETGLLPVAFLLLGAVACALFIRFPERETPEDRAGAEAAGDGSQDPVLQKADGTG
ncbi:hypothetical protein ACFQ60_35320 [Streptomyces zhihengii]